MCGMGGSVYNVYTDKLLVDGKIKKTENRTIMATI
jgi:hypothetical protein